MTDAAVSSTPNLPRRPRRLVATLALMLGGLALLGPTAGAAPDLRAVATADEPMLTWGLQPTQVKDQPFRANFNLDLQPGQEIKDTVRLRNYSSDPIKLNLYATDALNAENGAIDLLPAIDQPKDVGTWVKLERTSVTLASNDSVEVPFTVKVPSDAEPGDHVGGIVSSYLGDTKDASGQVVKLDRRLGTRVQVRVAGALNPQLTISDLKTSWDGTLDPIGKGSHDEVSYTVTNAGNVRMGVNQQIKVSSPIGFPSKSVKPEALTELLPGNSVQVTQKVSGVWPTFRSSVKVTVTPTSTRDGDVFPPNVVASAKTGAWTIPWATLVLLLVIAGLFKVRQQTRKNRQDDTARELAALVDARLGQPAGSVPVGYDLSNGNGNGNGNGHAQAPGVPNGTYSNGSHHITAPSRPTDASASDGGRTAT